MGTKNRAFLKWAGGKFKLVDTLNVHLPDGKRLIEPFVGAGSVFLNTDYEHYLLCDINQDLINLYNIVKRAPEEYIKACRLLFVDQMNNKEAYYVVRQQFNDSKDPFQRSVFFMYLNRHGYNGLCRYNRKNKFNVPFGSYKKPYFPEKEIRYFSQKAQRAEFLCISYEQAFELAELGDVVYCDPPYVPLSATSSFTSYAGAGFALDDQALLAKISRHTSIERGIPVLISNHDTPLTRELYHGARLQTLKVHRSISHVGSGRVKVNELMALYDEVYHTGTLA